MPAVHVAIVDGEMARGLLEGGKRIESRFARQRRLPFGRVHPGDRIYFKVAGGDIIGRADARQVVLFDQLTPAAISSLRCRYNHAIRASAAYWHTRRHCRYGVLIWLRRFTRGAWPLAIPRQYGSSWLLLWDGAGQFSGERHLAGALRRLY